MRIFRQCISAAAPLRGRFDPTGRAINISPVEHHASLYLAPKLDSTLRRVHVKDAIKKSRHHRYEPRPNYSSADPNDPTNEYCSAPPGAGPSGLVTAKTLIHNWPWGTYLPVIFDARHEVGGLWAIQSPETKGRPSAGSPGTLDPCMRTNLSRFTVAFSDLSWESALDSADVPMFPQARQVGQYLAAYTARYIPAPVLRLGHRVVKTERLEGKDDISRWKVSWMREGWVLAHGSVGTLSQN